MSNHLQLAGNVAVDELDRLRRVNAQLDEALRQTRNEFSQMRMERDAMMQAVSGLRRLLAPLRQRRRMPLSARVHRDGKRQSAGWAGNLRCSST
jgi:hypothetical protein